MLVGSNWLPSWPRRTRCMNKNSSPIWKRQSRSGKRWRSVSLRSTYSAKLRKSNMFKGPWIGNLKWRPMIWDARRRTSWLLARSSNAKNNSWIRDKKWKNKSSRSRFTPSCGCSIMRRNSPGREEKLPRGKIRYRKRLISCHGRTIPKQWFKTKTNKRRQLSKKCSRSNGPLNRVQTRKRIAKNSSWTEKETSNL